MASQYEQLVFSGGGIRCFWHGGFLSEVGCYEDLRPDRISCVSGGALSAASWIGGREDDLLAVMHEAFLQSTIPISTLANPISRPIRKSTATWWT